MPPAKPSRPWIETEFRDTAKVKKGQTPRGLSPPPEIRLSYLNQSDGFAEVYGSIRTVHRARLFEARQSSFFAAAVKPHHALLHRPRPRRKVAALLYGQTISKAKTGASARCYWILLKYLVLPERSRVHSAISAPESKQKQKLVATRGGGRARLSRATREWWSGGALA